VTGLAVIDADRRARAVLSARTVERSALLIQVQDRAVETVRAG
jgi:hypothetical protein